MLGYPIWFVVWNPLSWDPSDGVFGRFDLAAPLRLPHLICVFVCLTKSVAIERLACTGKVSVGPEA